MSLGLEHDEFEALDLRTTVVFGMGNQLLDSKKQSLNARLGLGYQHENFEVGDDEGEAILDLGYDYALVLGKWAKLRQDTTYQSGLDAPLEEYRIIANTGLELPLASDQAWRVRTGVKHEYDDEPLPGIERLDTTYYLNLAYDW